MEEFVFPAWAIALATILGLWVILFWIPQSRKRLIKQGTPYSKLPRYETPPIQELPKEDPQNAADKVAFRKFSTYVITALAIGYLGYFYCCLEPSITTATILSCAICWLFIMLLPSSWVQKNQTFAILILLPLGILANFVPIIMYDLELNKNSLLYIAIICIYALGYKYDASKPGKLWNSSEPYDPQKPLPLWITGPVMFLMVVVVLFILWFLFGVAYSHLKGYY